MTTAGPLLRREGTTTAGRRFVIRPTGDDDAPGLAAVLDAIAAEGEFIVADPGEAETLQVSARLVSIVAEGGLSLSLEVDSVLAGNVMVYRRSGRHYAHVGEIAIVVANDQRGSGFGRTLMEMAIAWCRAVGLTKLSLQVFTDNERAIALYRALGFVEEGVAHGEVRMPSGDRDLLLMALTL